MFYLLYYSKPNLILYSHRCPLRSVTLRLRRQEGGKNFIKKYVYKASPGKEHRSMIKTKKKFGF